jgi:hypothetical protein
VLFEASEPLHEGISAFLTTHPHWTMEQLVAAALAFWLMQQDERTPDEQRALAQIYLDAMLRGQE